MKHNQTIAQIGWGAALVGSVVLMTSCFSLWPTESQEPSSYLTVTPVHGSYLYAIAIGDTVRLTAVARDGRGQTIPAPTLTWSTNNPAFATVAQDGLVTGRGQGFVIVLAQSAQMVGSTSFQVTLPFTRVGIQPESTEIVAGGAASFRAVPEDSNGMQVGSVTRVLWSIEDTTIARIDTSGTVTGLSAGKTTVRALIGDRVGSAAISVITINYTTLVTGTEKTCGLTVEGKAYCWGASQRFPGPFTDSQFTSLSAGGANACGITREMEVHCSEATYFYQSPVRGKFRLVAVGASFTCGLSDFPDPGHAYCWGLSTSQQLGAPAPDGCGGFKGSSGMPCARDPVPVAGGLVFTALDAGEAHTCGLTAEGLAYCWGDNRSGQLGDPAYTDSSRGAPAPVAGGITFTSLSSGDRHTCGLDLAGRAYCWGSNQFGQLGVDDAANASVRQPQPIASSLTFRSITAGGKHTCAISTANTVYCWGSNAFGQLGYGNTAGIPRPVLVSPNLAFQQISAGSAHTCGRSTAGLLYCWGSNDNGALGTGDFVSRTEPVLVVGQRAPQ